jgi:peptidoglycan/LPS O-acetylase OafA/YrhL
MKYRREIDGLRALAVLPVIMFHAGVSSFSGGFVGVDVFFVISGYLITTIIATELDQRSFSILNFYERRARRILPALFFVMICTLPFAWLWMLPTELKDYSKSLIAVPLFSSNILFSYTSGYFDIASELRPLLHTWSLAVEEQYYILFPFVLMLIWRLPQKLTMSLLLSAAVISLLIAQWSVAKHTTTAFYLLPTRAFELLIGALISLHFIHKHRFVSRNPESKKLLDQAFSFIGLALIIYAVFAFDSDTPSPSFHSLVPTFGAGLIIIFASNKTAVGKLLGSKVFVGIGLISYSAYLWHQPIVAFTKLRHMLGFDQANAFFVVALSLTLAYLSWRFIEKPFRDKGLYSSKSIVVFSVVGTIFFIVVGAVIHLQGGFRDVNSRVPPNVKWLSLSEKLDLNGDICNPLPHENLGISVCNFGDLKSRKNVVFYGDSHAQAIGEQLNNALVDLKIRGIKVVIDDCEVVPELRLYSKKNTDTTEKCIVRFRNMLDYIKNHNADVVVSSRWSMKLYPIKGTIDDMPSRNSEGGVEHDLSYREYVSVVSKSISFSDSNKKIAVKNLLDGLLSATDKLYVVHPIPEISWDIARLNISHYRTAKIPLNEISIPHSDFKTRNKFVNSIFDEYINDPRFIAVKPEDIFCNSFIKDRCVAQYQSVPFYYDDDHLSDAGARLVVEKLINSISIISD